MKITFSEEALDWFKNEMGLTKGDYLKFYARIYGSSPVQKSYSLGFSKEDPIDMAVSTEKDGIIFFVDAADVWYFNGHDLHVEYNETYDEIEFQYHK